MQHVQVVMQSKKHDFKKALCINRKSRFFISQESDGQIRIIGHRNDERESKDAHLENLGFDKSDDKVSQSLEFKRNNNFHVAITFSK